jgi:MFS family permease
MPIGCLLVALAAFGGYFISAIWHVYILIGCVGGLGLAMNGFATNTAIMPRWFVHKRGRATGIVLSGIGIGILALVPMIERMIDMWGWRLAYVGYGAIVLLVITPASYFILRDRPEDVGQERDGLPSRPDEQTGPETAPSDEPVIDKSVRSVFLTLKGDYRFWSIMFLYFAIGFNNNTIMSQVHLYFVDIGFTTAASALVLGAVGFLRTAGSISGGWIGDLIGRGRGAAIAAVVVNAGLILLLLIPAMGGGLVPAYTFAIVYGIGIGAMSACGSALGGDIFEGPTYGVIVGFTEICYGLGGVVGPPLAGFFFDYTQSYSVPFSLIIVILFISIIASLTLQKSLDNAKTKTAS